MRNGHVAVGPSCLPDPCFTRAQQHCQELLKRWALNVLQVEVDRSRRVCISGKTPPLHTTDYGRLHKTQASSCSPTTSTCPWNAAEHLCALQLDTAWRSTQRERQPGTFRRAWMLPEDANVAAMHAFVRHGILVLTIEKKGAHQSSEAPHT